MPELSVTETDDFKSLLFEQQLAFLGALHKDNVLITGGGGVGKSHLIRILERHIRGLVLTATTGIAAINIGGQTLDRFMGFGIQPMTPSAARRMRADVRQRLEKLEVLLLDEASMSRIDKFECMNARLQAAKKNKLPFGGVQIILVGDFCQLSPIVGKRPEERQFFRDNYQDRVHLFESEVYEQANFIPYVLTEYVRQGDETQQRVLRNLRMGARLKEAVEVINNMAIGSPTENSIYLVSNNRQADGINERRYSEISGKEKGFWARKDGEFHGEPVPEQIKLKIGSRVMICANNPDEDYYNGDRGVVSQFTKEGVKVNLDRGLTVDVSKFEWQEFAYDGRAGEGLDKDPVGTFTQIPIKLAYAITMHKSQGMTLDDVVLDLYGVFADAQAYVGLSRLRSFDGLCLVRPLRLEDIRINIKSRNFTLEVSTAAMMRREEDLERFSQYLKKAA